MPIDFNEVTITRRLFRSGESEYAINKAPCRLKDIHSLLADTGLGKNSISVISQNKVDEVLNNRPQERRLLFEECAGITKYRDRKKEALRKLDYTSQNILRLQDIISEIEKQLGPLEQEATKTEKYNQLKADFDHFSINKILRDYEAASALQSEIDGQLRELSEQKAKLQAKAQAAQAQLAALEEKQHLWEIELEKINSANGKLNSEVQKSRAHCTVLEERIRQSAKTLTALREKRELLLKEQAQIAAQIKETKTLLTSIEEEQKRRNDALSAQERQVEELKEDIEKRQKSLDDDQEKSQLKRQHLEERKNHLIFLERDLKQLHQNQSDLIQRQEQSTIRLKEQQEERENLKVQIQDLRSKQEELTQKSALQRQNAKKLREDAQKAQSECAKIENKLQAGREKEKILRAMQENYDGFGGAIRHLLKTTLPWRQNICGAVAELLSVEKQYATAIETALGNSLQNVVTEDTKTAQQAIDFLKRGRLGRATFLPLTAVREKGGKFAPHLGDEGFIAFADALVKTDKKYRPLMKNLLARTIVADKLENALKIAKLNDYSVKIVTLEGEILYPGGALTGGSLRREAGFLNRASQLEQLHKESDMAVKSLLVAKSHWSELLKKADDAETTLNKARKILQDNDVLIAEKNASLRYFDERLLKDRREKERLDEEMKKLLSAIDKAAFSYQEEEKALAALSAQGGKLAQKLEQQLQQIESLRQKREKMREQIFEQQVSAAAVAEKLAGSKEKERLLQGQFDRAANDIAEGENERQKTQETMAAATEELQEQRKSIDSLEQLLSSSKDEYTQKYKTLMDSRIDIKKMQADCRKCGDDLSVLDEKIHKREMKAAEKSFSINELEKLLYERHGLILQTAMQYREDIEPQILEENLKNLRAKMQSIGTVNPNAIKEYQALSERQKFMAGQIGDLQQAMDNLQQIITKIDQTMTEQFTLAFGAIERYFNTIFQKLFGGGKAELILTSPDSPLDTGIDIMARPPDKKNQSLAMLSGGERTLTVIALLFAFLAYRPAPFSVLDEIDAPLDEANIKRFGEFLRDYAQQTQFIIVTHRKSTMEATDIIYGVTMEEPGVSKLISVKLETEQENGIFQ